MIKEAKERAIQAFQIESDSIIATRECMAENLSSPLADKSDIVVPIKVTSETDKYNSQGTSSFTALATVFDALQTAIIEETGYKNEQFALIHPAGAVGKRLNKK